MANEASKVAEMAGQPMLIGEWTLDASLNELQRDGTTIRLEPKAIEVLVFLAAHPGEVISRETILEAVWPGTVVGDDSLTQAVIKLRRALGDEAQRPRYIETISKRGYRLIAAVTTAAVSAPAVDDAASGGVPSAAGPGRPWPDRVMASRPAQLLAVWVLVLVLAVSIVRTFVPNGPSGAPVSAVPGVEGAPVVAVLPLANLSGDPQREYFSDGVTQDIIAALGRFPTLRVMSLNAVVPYKSRQLTPREVREQLGARYVVSGSLGESAGGYRVSVELSDAESGIVLWSDRLDGEGRELFDIQNRIVMQVTGRVAGNVARLEAERALARPPASMLAYDHVLRARSLLLNLDRASNRNARILLEKAVQLAPNYGEALVGLAQAENQRAVNGWVEDAAGSLNKAEEYLNRTIALGDPGSRARAHGELSMILSARGQLEQALAEADAALELNPSDAFVLDRRGATLMYLGRLDEAVASMSLGARLDPSVRGLGGQLSFALANYALQRYDESLRRAEMALERYPSAPELHALRAATLARLARTDEARTAAAELILLAPFFDPDAFGSRFVNPAHRAHVREGLRRAGL